MARPARRVVIGLALRMNKAPAEIATWDISDIRDCMAMLIEQGKPPKKSMSDDEIESRFNALTE